MLFITSLFFMYNVIETFLPFPSSFQTLPYTLLALFQVNVLFFCCYCMHILYIYFLNVTCTVCLVLLLCMFSELTFSIE